LPQLLYDSEMDLSGSQHTGMSLRDTWRSCRRIWFGGAMNAQEVFMKMSFYYIALGTVIALAGCSKDAGSADVGPSSSISGGAGGEGSGPTGTGGAEPADNPAADNPAPGGTGTDTK
jgi:hypothetical protein